MSDEEPLDEKKDTGDQDSLRTASELLMTRDERLNMLSASERFVPMKCDGAKDCRANGQHKTCFGIHLRQND